MKSQKFKLNWDGNVPDWSQRLLVEDNILQEQRQSIYDLTSASGTSWFKQQVIFFVDNVLKTDAFFDSMQTKVIGSIIDFDE